MLRQTLVVICLSLSSQLALAGEAGKVIFTAGAAQQAGAQLVEGAAVQEGTILSTGADGFIYVKTADNGLFILRPNTKARIVAYHIDAANPANTRIKLELISGIARSRSGDAVKLARQNFRFNTPVAAIGVRGTDFTVYTDQDTSRVAVIAGGVVVTAFGGACSAEGIGPCEGAASRELSATQRGQLLQVTRGKTSPQLLQGGALSPDQMTPPRSDEPVAGGASAPSVTAGVQPNLDAAKGESLNKAANNAAPPAAPGPVVPPTMPVTPPLVTVPVPELPTPPPVVVDNRPDQGIIWGRWQQVGGAQAPLDLTAVRAKGELLAVNGNYALLRTPGKDYVTREAGEVGFALQSSEAFVYTDRAGGRVASPAVVTDGKLNIDFGSKEFKTSLNLLTIDERFAFSANGKLTSDGRLHGDAAGDRPGLLNVQGLLSNEKGGTAAYIFDGRIDELRTVNGATYWAR